MNYLRPKKDVSKAPLIDKLTHEVKVFRLARLMWTLGAILTAVLIYQTGKFPIGGTTFYYLETNDNASGTAIWEYGLSFLESYALYSIPRWVVVVFYATLILWKYGTEYDLLEHWPVFWPFIYHFGALYFVGVGGKGLYSICEGWGWPLEIGTLVWWCAYIFISFSEWIFIKIFLRDKYPPVCGIPAASDADDR